MSSEAFYPLIFLIIPLLTSPSIVRTNSVENAELTHTED